MANFYCVPGGAGSKNGSNWSNAFDHQSISWGSVGSGDTIFLSGGSTKAVYNGGIDIGRSNVTLRLSAEAGHDGRAIIFGGRRNRLPHSLIASSRWTSQGTARQEPGIDIGGYSNVTIDGRKWQGISIHGFFGEGIRMSSSSGGSNTIRYVDVFDNGEAVTHKTPGRWRTDWPGIRIAGDNNVVEYVWLHRNGQDGIQSTHAQQPNSNTLRYFLITNEVSHVDNPHFCWNWREHPDGLQIYTGATGWTIHDGIIAHQWHALILGDSYGGFHNSTIDRLLLFDNANAFRFHGRASNNNNTVRDIVSKKWGWYYDDNGRGYFHGEHFYLRGTGNAFHDSVWSNHGSFSINSSATWSNQYQHNIRGGVPNASTQNPNFPDPGPEGRERQNLVNGWSTRDFTIRNSNITGVTQTYTGPLDYLEKITGIEYATWPDEAHATNSNKPEILAAGTLTLDANTTDTYQISARNIDGGSLSYSLSNPPSWLAINSSTGLITATNPPNNGVFRTLLTVQAVGGKNIQVWFKVDVGGTGGGGNSAPSVQNPGTLAAQVNTPFNYQIQANDPDGDTLTYSATGLPTELTIDSGSGIISGTPTIDFDDTVVVSVSDGTNPATVVNFRLVIDANSSSGATTLIDVDDQTAEIDPGMGEVKAVYLDELFNDWNDVSVPSGGTYDLESTENQTGDTAIQVNMTGAGDFTIGRSVAYTLADYENIKFWVKASHELTLALNDSVGGQESTVTIGSYFSGGSFVADTWAELTIPIADLTGSNTDFDEIILRNPSSTNPVFYVDEIELHKPAPTVSAVDVTVAESDALDLDADADNLPDGLELQITQAIPSAPSSGSGSGGDTVDTTSGGAAGTDSGTSTQIYDFGDVGGSNFTLTVKYIGHPTSSNPGGPTRTGNIRGGAQEYRTGDGPGTTSGTRNNRLEITSNRPLASLDWGAYGFTTGSEDIPLVSHDGSVTGLGPSSTGTISWSGLDGETVLYADITSNSDGNNHSFPAIGDAVLFVNNNESEPGVPGTVKIVGTPEVPGIYDILVTVRDANGVVGTVEVNYTIGGSYFPVIKSFPSRTDSVGDVITQKVSAYHGQGLVLEYSAANLPTGLTIDPDTGIISGTITEGGVYEAVVKVEDEFGQCDVIKATWTVNGDKPNSYENMRGPVVLGRRSTELGPVEFLPPAIARALLDVYSKAEVLALLEALKAEIIGGEIELTTLKLLADRIRAIEENDGGGGETDLSNIYTILGRTSNDNSLGSFTSIIPSGRNINTAFQDLVSYIETLVLNSGAETLQLPANTIAANFTGSAADAVGQTYGNFRTELALYTITQVDNLLAAKAEKTVVDTLVALAGVGGAANLGTFTDYIRANATIKQAFEDVVITLADLYLNGGGDGGGGSVNLQSQSLYGRSAAGTGPGVSIPYGSVPGLIGAATVTQLNTEINELREEIIDGAPTALNTLNKIAASISDDPTFASSMAAALSLKANQNQVSALQILTGQSEFDGNLGNFDGSTIPNNQSIKAALQALETALENISGGTGTTTSWQNVTSLGGTMSGWTTSSGNQLRYRLWNGKLEIDGTIDTTTPRSPSPQHIIFTLPSTHRPARNQRSSTSEIKVDGGADVLETGAIIINTDGNVRFWAVNTNIRQVRFSVSVNTD